MHTRIHLLYENKVSHDQDRSAVILLFYIIRIIIQFSATGSQAWYYFFKRGHVFLVPSLSLSSHSGAQESSRAKHANHCSEGQGVIDTDSTRCSRLAWRPASSLGGASLHCWCAHYSALPFSVPRCQQDRSTREAYKATGSWGSKLAWWLP